MQLYYNKKKDRVFNALLCLYLFYYSYRYIFQYNSSTTSPTYSDTPMLFQIGKYALLVLLIVILMFRMGWNGRIVKNWKNRGKRTLIAVIFLVFQFLTYGLLTKNIDAIAFALILVPPIFFLISPRKVCIEHVEKVLFVFWWFSFIYELFQILLYIRTGRLPALAYPTGKITDVRFGGAWDDPNGYSLLMIFYVFYYLFKYKGIKQIAYLGATMLMLLLTWSGTGYIAFIATALIILIVRLRDKILLKKYLYYGMLTIVVLGSVFIMKRASIVDTLAYYLETKSESISQHQSGWGLLSNLSILTLLGIKPEYIYTEVGYIRLISIGGIPALLAFFVIANRICKQVKSLLKGRSNKALLYGILAYTIGFILFNVNLPHFISFYCMGVLCSFISLLPSVVRTNGVEQVVIDR